MMVKSVGVVAEIPVDVADVVERVGLAFGVAGFFAERVRAEQRPKLEQQLAGLAINDAEGIKRANRPHLVALSRQHIPPPLGVLSRLTKPRQTETGERTGQRTVRDTSVVALGARVLQNLVGEPQRP